MQNLQNFGFLQQIRGRLGNHFEKFKQFFQMIQLVWEETLPVSKGTYILLVICAFYVISPIDLIPDAIPVVGMLDDLGVIILVISALSQLFILSQRILEARDKFQVDKIYEEAECMVCMSNPSDVIFSCGHKICCKQCQRIGGYRKCFLCKKQ